MSRSTKTTIPILTYSSPPRRHLGNSGSSQFSHLSYSSRPHSWDFSSSSSSSNSGIDFRTRSGLRNRTYSVEDGASAFSAYTGVKHSVGHSAVKPSILSRTQSDNISLYLKSNQKLDLSDDGSRFSVGAKDSGHNRYTFHVPRSPSRWASNRNDDYNSARNLSPSERILRRSVERLPKSDVSYASSENNKSLNESFIMSMENLEIDPSNSAQDFTNFSQNENQSRKEDTNSESDVSNQGLSNKNSVLVNSQSDSCLSGDKDNDDDLKHDIPGISDKNRFTSSTTFTVNVVCPPATEESDIHSPVQNCDVKPKALDSPGSNIKQVYVSELDKTYTKDMDINQNKPVFPDLTKSPYCDNLLTSPNAYKHIVDPKKAELAARGRYSPRGIVEMDDGTVSAWDVPEQPVASPRWKGLQVTNILEC